MKKLLLALSLVCCLSNAATIATMVNQSKGQIILTDVKCSKKDGGYVAYATEPNQKTGFGCYFWTPCT